MTENKKRRAFSKEEISRIETLLKTRTYREVAVMVGRNPGTLMCKFSKNKIVKSGRKTHQLKKRTMILDAVQVLKTNIRSELFSEVDNAHMDAMIEHLLLMDV